MGHQRCAQRGRCWGCRIYHLEIGGCAYYPSDLVQDQLSPAPDTLNGDTFGRLWRLPDGAARVRQAAQESALGTRQVHCRSVGSLVGRNKKRPERRLFTGCLAVERHPASKRIRNAGNCPQWLVTSPLRCHRLVFQLSPPTRVRINFCGKMRKDWVEPQSASTQRIKRIAP